MNGLLTRLMKLLPPSGWIALVEGVPPSIKLGPVPGDPDFFLIYFVTHDYQRFYGIATVLVDGRRYYVPPLGCCFFYPSGQPEGVFNPQLYTESGIRKYLAGCHSESGKIASVKLVQPGVSIYPWLWEVVADGQTYYLYVINHQGTGKLLTKQELERARAADVVNVDSLITDGGRKLP